MRSLLQADTLITQLIQQLYLALALSWGVIILIGNFMALFLIAFGIVSWMSDWRATRGKRMVLGGIVLFLIMQWMAISAPFMLPFIY